MQRQFHLQSHGSQYDLSHKHSGVLPYTLSGIYRELPIQIATAYCPLRQLQMTDLAPMTYRGVWLQAA